MWPGSAPTHVTWDTPIPNLGSATVNVCHLMTPQGNRSLLTLPEDLGDTPPLPTDLACYLEDATDEQIDTSHPPVPSATSSPRPPSNSDNFRLLCAMNCCYCGDPSISPSAATWPKAVLRSWPAAHHLLPTEGTVSAYFSLLWLQPASSMHWGPAPS